MSKPSCRVGAPCQIEANGIDTENHTVPVILSDETHVVRYSWDDGYYFLRLVHDKQAVDLSRADILSMFVNHDTYSTLPIARFEDVRIEDAKLKATAVFDAEDEESMTIFSKLSRGFLTSFSVGIDIFDRVLTEEKDGVKYYDATQWAPYEASVVGIPANPNATVGLTATTTTATMPTAPSDKIAKSQQGNLMDFNKENFAAQTKRISDLEAELAKEKQQSEQLAKDAKAAEVKRMSEIFTSVGVQALTIDTVKETIFTPGASLTDVEAAMFRHEKAQKEQMAHTIQTEGQTLAGQIAHIDGDPSSGAEMSDKARRHQMALEKAKANKGGN